MSALSRAWQEEHGGGKPARGRLGRQEEDIPTMVRKALSDNFPVWSEGEIYHIKHNGLSLYDALYQAKQAWVKCKSVKHGPFCYENLRTKYSCESRPWNQIKIPDIDQVPCALLDALEAHLRHKKGPIIAFAESLAVVESESQVKTLMVALSNFVQGLGRFLPHKGPPPKTPRSVCKSVDIIVYCHCPPAEPHPNPRFPCV